VAREAGVASSTASDALNQRGRMADATRQRVIAAAKGLGYLPNPAARGLRAGKSRLVGIALRMYIDSPDQYPGDVYYGQLITVASSVANSRGYAFALLPAHDLEVAGELALAALIITDTSQTDPTLEQAYTLGIPIITDHRPGDNRASVVVDVNIPQAIHLANEHLVAAGARRIGFLAIEPVDTSYAVNFEQQEKRWCAEHDIELVVEHAGSGNSSAVVEGTKRLIGAGCDAILANPIGAGPDILRAANSEGVNIPADLLVLVVDDDPAMATTHPALSTMSLDPIRTASEGTELVIDVLEGKVSTPAHLLIDAILHPRESTAAFSRPSRLGLE